MKKIKIIALVMLVVLVSACLFACGTEKKEVTVNVKVVNADKEVILEDDVTFTSSKPTALEALQYLCFNNDETECVIDENNTVIKIGDYEEYTDKEAGLLYFWNWKYNGKNPPARAGYTEVSTDDKIEFFFDTMEAQSQETTADTNEEQ